VRGERQGWEDGGIRGEGGVRGVEEEEEGKRWKKEWGRHKRKEKLKFGSFSV